MSASGLLDDEKGVLSWLLTQISLIIAAGVLIGAIAGISFYGDWQKEAELKNIASNFVASLISLELREFPYEKTYLFPLKNYHYEVELSSDYITVRREDGTINKNIICREELPIKPIITAGKNLDWTNSTEFHKFLSLNYGCDGSPESPIPLEQREEVFSYIEQEMKYNAHETAAEPITICDLNKPLYMEKTFIYFEKGDGRLYRRGIIIIHE